MRFVVVLVFTVCSAFGEQIELSCDQIRTFVDGHNNRRLEVAQGLVPGQPAASEMQFMVWDEELAEKASKWAANGLFRHNPDRSIGSHRWNLIGENIYVYNYYSSSGDAPEINIENALDSWFQEYKYYHFEPFFLRSLNPFGHYTQMVWSTTKRVGCGISQTKKNIRTRTLFVCDYGPPGNFFQEKPYKTEGSSSDLQCSDDNCETPYGPNCSEDN